MAYAPFPSNDGNELHGPARSAGFRLTDAEKIAADRLEANRGGSLEEALAGVRPGAAPRDDIEGLADRIEAAQSAYTTVIVPSSTLPFVGERPAQFAGGVVQDSTPINLPEWSDARAAMLAELAEMSAQPLFLQEEARRVAGTSWQPVAHEAEPIADLDAPRPTADPREPAAEVPKAEVQAKPAAVPLASALDTAAKLSAEADAAVAALESLSRMLHDQQRVATKIPAPQQVSHTASQRAPQSASRPIVSEPARPRPQAQAAKPPAAVRAVPRPTARPAQRAVHSVTPPSLRPAPPSAAERRQFDLRGFMAGFALSWALGAVLYIYLMVG